MNLSFLYLIMFFLFLYKFRQLKTFKMRSSSHHSTITFAPKSELLHHPLKSPKSILVLFQNQLIPSNLFPDLSDDDCNLKQQIQCTHLILTTSFS